MSISAAEQYFIELINRARLDPAAEAKRLGIALNEELPAGTISTASKTPLAINLKLTQSSRDHSDWMLDADVFSHTGSGGSSVRNRIEAANYALTGSWAVGENLSWRTVSGSNAESLMNAHHRALFDSSGHRQNFFSDAYLEIGVAEEQGFFRYAGTNYFSSMVTNNFAKSGSGVFITGVAYSDNDNDKFYSIGEGRAGYEVSVGNQSTNTLGAGGYSLKISPSSAVTVRIEAASKTGEVIVDASGGNAKVDLINQNTVASSTDLTLKSGFNNARLLGGDDLDVRGNGASNRIEGNDGTNIFNGLQGNDTLIGFAGNDVLNGQVGNDRLFGGTGNDVIRGGFGFDVLGGGGGNDRLFGGNGEDTLNGGFGRDKLYGGGRDDRLVGGGGNDVLVGNGGFDVLFGNKGNDRLNGGIGTDNIFGGNGADDFVYFRGNKRDIIRDFDVRENDELLLDRRLWDGNLSAQQVVDQYGSSNGGNSWLSFGDFNVIALRGVSDLDDIVDHIEFI